MFNLFKNKGVVESFEENLFQCLDSLYNFAYSLTRHREEAEDLVQEAALRGFNAYHKFTEGTNFKAWIFTILRNVYINQYRKMPAWPEPQRQRNF